MIAIITVGMYTLGVFFVNGTDFYFDMTEFVSEKGCTTRSIRMLDNNN